MSLKQPFVTQHYISNIISAFCIFIGCIPYNVLAQESEQVEPLKELVLSIQYGKGGSIQEFRLKSSEAVFVQIGKPQSPNNQPSPQEAKGTDAYQKQRAQLAEKIANKISEIQRKQQELDSEVYPAYRAPIGVEIQALEQDLKQLETQRSQLEAQQIVNTAQKSSQAASAPPPTVANGITVRATIVGSSASLTIQGQGKEATTTTIQAPINAWVQIFSVEKGQGQDIWAKVAPLGT